MSERDCVSFQQLPCSLIVESRDVSTVQVHTPTKADDQIVACEPQPKAPCFHGPAELCVRSVAFSALQDMGFCGRLDLSRNATCILGPCQVTVWPLECWSGLCRNPTSICRLPAEPNLKGPSSRCVTAGF